MRCFDDLVGNDDVRARLGRAILDRRLPHALIIEGEAGTGKRTLALSIAAALLCTDAEKAEALPCGKCRACRRVLAGQDPDVVRLSRDGASIGVDAVRAMRRDMYLSATEADRKIYIIDEAHTMTPQAQNSLLKVLEEPPTALTVMLLTERREALLSTVLSRAQTVRMSLLTHEEMERLADKRPSLDVIRRSRPDAWREMLLASGGNAGKLAELADGSKADGSAHMRECVRTILVTAAQKRGYASLSEQVQRMGTKRQQAADHLSLLYDGLRDLALISRDEEIEMIFWLDREEARAVAHRLGEARIAAMCRAVADAREALSKNANVPLVLSTLTLKFS